MRIICRMNPDASVLRSHLPICLKRNTEQKATLSPDIKQQDRVIRGGKLIRCVHVYAQFIKILG